MKMMDDSRAIPNNQTMIDPNTQELSKAVYNIFDNSQKFKKLLFTGK
jgi:hypothetical protein